MVCEGLSVGLAELLYGLFLSVSCAFDVFAKWPSPYIGNSTSGHADVCITFDTSKEQRLFGVAFRSVGIDCIREERTGDNSSKSVACIVASLE